MKAGRIVAVAATAVAAALYAATVPDGLPWNDSVHLALAYLGVIVPMPDLPHPVWGFHVQVFGGAVALSAVMAALGAGFLAALVNRYFGWRLAAGVALVWTFLPGVWNRAVTGERGVCLAATAVIAAWALNGVLLKVLRRAREVYRAKKGVDAVVTTHEVNAQRARTNRLLAWLALGTSCLFAVVSLTAHDYRLGEAASVFARGVVDAAGKRVIVLNGLCDDQVVTEAAARGRDSRGQFATLSLRKDDAYRTNVVAWARREWPDETNLWVSAQVSAATFADLVTKRHPERFYLMNGQSTTLEALEKRWLEFVPSLTTTDPFVPRARRMFGYEGNAVANALADAKKEKSAWLLYKRIYEEIDPGNFSALANMNELIRRGHAVSGDEKKALHEKLETFFRDANNRKRLRGIVRASGPVRVDPEMLEKMAEEAKKRIAAKVAAGEKIEAPPEILSLVEWNNEMVQRMDKGEIAKAGRIARMILSNPQWRGFISANAVMGVVSAQEGDYVASEAFFRIARATTNRVASVTLNDFADTLMRLGKMDEAEAVARRAVRESSEDFWLPRLTLAEVLEKKVGRLERVEVVKDGEKTERYVKIKGAEKIEAEIRDLLRRVLHRVPPAVRSRLRKEHGEYVK